MSCAERNNLKKSHRALDPVRPNVFDKGGQVKGKWLEVRIDHSGVRTAHCQLQTRMKPWAMTYTVWIWMYDYGYSTFRCPVDQLSARHIKSLDSEGYSPCIVVHFLPFETVLRNWTPRFAEIINPTPPSFAEITNHPPTKGSWWATNRNLRNEPQRTPT